jgi:hypothetical protein
LELKQQVELVQELELAPLELAELPPVQRREQRHLRPLQALRQLRQLDQQRQQFSVELQRLVMGFRCRLYLWRLPIVVHREQLALLLS